MPAAPALDTMAEPASARRAVDSDAPHRGHPLASLLAASIAGSAVQLLQASLWRQEIYACLIAPALFLIALSATNRIAFRGQSAFGSFARPLLVLSIAAAAFGLTGWRAAQYAAHALQPALEGRDLQIDATIAAMPQRNALGLRLRVAVNSATLDGQAVAVPPLIDLGWWSPVRADRPAGKATATTRATAPGPNAELPDVRAGDRWRLTARLKAPHGSRNPYGFDYELWAWEHGVQATGSVRNGKKNTPPLLLAASWQHPIERARQSVRDAILVQLAPSGADAKADPDTDAPKVDEPADDQVRGSEATESRDRGRQRAAGVVAALVTGDQRAIDRSDWDIFRATGTAHLVSISGLHITMFAWLAALAIGTLWRRSTRLCLRWPAPHAALGGGIVCAAAYALFSGGGLPAQRTILMLLVVGGLRISAKRWPWPLVWLQACALVVLVDPWALLQAGFWLSFIAVGVLFASGLGAIDGIAGSANGTSATGTFYQKIRVLLREQAVVTLALTPLTLMLFGQASLVGFIANLVAIPWTTLVVTPLALLGVLIHPVWNLAALAVQALASVLQWLAAVPHAVVALPAAPVWAGVAAVAGGVLLCMRLPWSLRLLGVAPMLPLLLWQQPRPAQGQFELLAADIGQGEAVLIRTAHHALLYDTGPRFSADDDAGHRVLVPLLQALGETLDTVVVSHRDSDHAGGAAAVLAAQPQATFRSSIEASNPLQRLRKVERCIAGQSWNWDGVHFSILHPQAADYIPAARSNALSCVLRVESANHAAALLTGDIEAEQEAALVKAKAPLAADVLVAPHHGSRHSSSAVFLQAVAPRLVIVQAGYRNRYGHPAPESLQHYADQGSAVIASPGCGAARWQSDAPPDIHCERMDHRHYWQHALPEPGPPDTSIAAAKR